MLLSLPLIIDVTKDTKAYLVMGLIYISLMSNDFMHLYIFNDFYLRQINLNQILICKQGYLSSWYTVF